MKRQRIASGVLSFIFISGQFTLVKAQEIITAPAVYVTAKQVKSLQKDVLNQDRLNRDEEIRVKKLIDDNKMLMKANSTSSTNLKEINEALDQYSQQINQRDRMRIATNGYKVRQVKDGAYESDPIYVNIIVDELQGKKQALRDKYQDLTLLRDELARINERLREHNSKQDQLLVKYSEDVDNLRQKLSKAQQVQLERIEASNNSIAEKNAQLNELRQQLKNQQGKIDQLSSALNSKTSQMDDTSAQFEETRTTIADKNEQIAQLGFQVKEQQQKIEQLKNNLNEKSAESIDNSAQWQEANSKLKALTAKLKDSDDAIARFDQAIAEKDAQISRLTEELNVAAQKSDSLTDKVSTLTAQLKDATTNMAKAIQVKDEEIVDLKNKVAQLTNDQQGLEEVGKIHQQVADLKAEFDQKDKDLSLLEELVAKLQLSITEKDNTINANKVEIGQLKDQLAQAIEQTHAYKEQAQQVDQLNDTIASLRAMIRENNNGKELIAQRDAQLEAIINDRNSDQQRLAKIALEKENVAKDHQVYKQDAQERFELAKELIAHQEEQIVLLQEKERLAQVHAQTLRGQVDHFSSSYTNLNDAKATLEATWKSQVEQANKQAALQQTQLRDYQMKTQQTALALTTQEQARDQLEKRLLEANQILAKKEEQLSLLKEEIRKKIAESAQMAEMLNVYQDKLKTKNDDYEGKLDEVMLTKKHQAQLERSITDLTDQLALKEAEIKKVKEYFYELENRFANKDKDLKAKDVSLSMMQQMIDQGKIENDAKVNDLMTQIKAQQDQLNALRKDLAMAQQEATNAPKADEIKKLQDDVIKANKHVADLSGQLIVKENELMAFKAQLSGQDKKAELSVNETKRLTAEIAKLKEEINRRITDVEYKDLEIKRLKEQFEAKERVSKTQILELTNSLKMYESKVKNTPSPDALKALKMQLIKSQKEIDVLRNQNGDKGEELVKLRTKLAELEAAKASATISQDKTAALNGQIKQLKDQLADTLAKQDSSDMRKALKDAQGEVKASREEIEQSRQRIADLNKQIAQLKAESKDLQANTKEADSYKAKIDALNEQLKAANKRLEEAADLKDDYKKLQEQLRISQESLEQNQQQLLQFKQLNDQVSSDKAKVASLSKEIERLNKQLTEQGSSEELKKQLSKTQKEVVALTEQLRSKQAGAEKQQQQFDQMRADLKAAKGQVTVVTEKLETYERLIEELGLGNEGFLIRNGKDTSMMLREINQRIKTVQTQLVQVTTEKDQAKEQYQTIQTQLEEARSLLQACMSKVMNQQKPTTYNAVDLMPVTK